MAHGGDAEWNQQVESIVAPLRQQYPLEVVFGMATTSTIQEAVRRLEAQDVRYLAAVLPWVRKSVVASDRELTRPLAAGYNY